MKPSLPRSAGRIGEPDDIAGRDHGMDASEAVHDRRATVTVDRQGIIRQWGDAVTDVVGYSADDAVGRSLDVIIPRALRPVHWWGFDQAMKSGRLHRDVFKVPALHKGGWIFVAHATIDLIPGKGRGADGAVVTFIGVGAPWRGRAWQATLAPVDFVHSVWRRARTR